MKAYETAEVQTNLFLKNAFSSCSFTALSMACCYCFETRRGGGCSGVRYGRGPGVSRGCGMTELLLTELMERAVPKALSEFFFFFFN